MKVPPQSPNLHLGPMSGNVIRATVSFAEKNNWPICLIASRRQIDAQQFGGGYVNNFSTEKFSESLRDSITRGHVILARDHGGPYQRIEEKDLPLEAAIKRTVQSYQTDMRSGFKIIHIDPEKAIERGAPNALETFTELTKRLLGECFIFLDKIKKNDVCFEIGSDEGVGMDFTPDHWGNFITEINQYCAKKGQPNPIAIAVPLGTKVKEDDNIGGLALNIQDPFWVNRVEDMKVIADINNIKLKLHNADYISSEVLKRYLDLGAEQINVAPQLGVVETKALINFLRDNNLRKHADAFLKISFESEKWERWLKDDSTANDEQKAIISGHYIFSTNEFDKLYKEVTKEIDSGRLESVLINEITKVIDTYYQVFYDRL